MFVFEALNAGDGDCLMLQHGSEKNPRYVVIDAGREPIWSSALKPRLAEIGDGPTIDLLVVSHIDEDHVAGVVAMLDDIDKGDCPATIEALWHNSFDADRRTDELAGIDPGGVASVLQGMKVRGLADKLGIEVNPEEDFPDGFVLRYADKVPRVALGDKKKPLTMVVLSPTYEDLQKLQREWDKDKRSKPQVDRGGGAGLGGSVTAVNLSSIALLAEYEGRRVLLSGDAEADQVVAGLRAAGLLVNDQCELDVLKVPHHGSSCNVVKGFFKMLPAANYVFSADGSNNNPDIETLDLLWRERDRARDQWQMWLTFPRDAYKDVEDTGEKARKRKAALRAVQEWINHHDVRVVYREPDALELAIPID